jgi:hypothetical protein
MKLAVVYDPNDNKLLKNSYSQCYRRQLVRLVAHPEWEAVQHITHSCSADDIEADVIVFYDIHSMHDVHIDGIARHKAVKYEYMDDPHQLDFVGRDGNGRSIHKLGAKERLTRTLKRKIQFIICPYQDSYHRFFGGYLGQRAGAMLFWWPISPDPDLFTGRDRPIAERMGYVLGNGAVNDQYGAYDFRRWAFRQPLIYHIQHSIYAKSTPRGEDYPQMLQRFAGALAAFEMNAVPKYMEIPLAGCVCFAQWNRDYYDLGFQDFVHCVYVDRQNFKKRIEPFLANPGMYQIIADAGRRLVETRYTANHFAAALFKHAKEHR